MSRENGRVHLLKEKDSKTGDAKPDMNTVELIFGTPNSPKISHQDRKPDTHIVANEKRHAGREPHTNLNSQDNRREVETFPLTQPLLEPDRGRQQPPLAGPEVDDLDDENEKPTANAPYPGIDDGLLEPAQKTPRKDHSNGESDDGDHSTKPEGDDTEFHHSTDDDGFGPGFDHRFGDDRPGSPFPGSIPDVNTYQQKKNLAQGMMDLALLSANANQLRYVLESSTGHPYYYFSLVFISLSIILQVAVGVGLIMNSRYNVKDEKDICKADKINNFTVLGIFLITTVNVFIAAFSVANNNNNLPNIRTDVQNVG